MRKEEFYENVSRVEYLKSTFIVIDSTKTFHKAL